MRHIKTYRLFEEQGTYGGPLDKLARKAHQYKTADDFAEDWVYLSGFNPMGMVERARKGEEIKIGKETLNAEGEPQGPITLYKTVTAKADYSNMWQFVLDHLPDEMEEGRGVWRKNKNKRPSFGSFKGKVVKAWHASPNRFDRFMYDEASTSGQVGAQWGFFFFTKREFAEGYASTFDTGYVYEVSLKIGKQLELNGEDIGTGWGRAGELESAEAEGYDSVLIKDADTGYGITDEIVIFDADRIKIESVDKV